MVYWDYSISVIIHCLCTNRERWIRWTLYFGLWIINANKSSQHKQTAPSSSIWCIKNICKYQNTHNIFPDVHYSYVLIFWQCFGDQVFSPTCRICQTKHLLLCVWVRVGYLATDFRKVLLPHKHCMLGFFFWLRASRWCQRRLLNVTGLWSWQVFSTTTEFLEVAASLWFYEFTSFWRSNTSLSVISQPGNANSLMKPVLGNLSCHSVSVAHRQPRGNKR